MRQIKRRSFLSSSASLLGGGLIIGENGRSQSQGQAPAGDLRHHLNTASVMTEAANRFLAMLSPAQKAKAVFPFGDEERMRWFVTPGPVRKGLALEEMNSYLMRVASALVAAGLSQEGYIKAVTVMSLQGMANTDFGYYLSIFGVPSNTGTWGYRVEGHHLSQNYTITNGHVVNGPSFFGCAPAEVKQGPRQGLRTLPQEEDLGFETIHTLDETLQKVAIVDANAYEDIFTVNTRKAALKGQPSGLLATRMNAKQFDALRALTELYARNLPDDMAQRRLDQIDKAGRNAWFAWAGETKPGVPHYYRVQTDSFLIEFDNLDATGNHIHSVWRDIEGDWGGDVLEAHYQESHRGEKL